MLSNALRQYLNQRENLPRETVVENEEVNNPQLPNNARVATGHTSSTLRNNNSTRRGRSGKPGSRDVSLPTSKTVTNKEQLATTNISDIELLSCIFFIPLKLLRNSIFLTLIV